MALPGQTITLRDGGLGLAVANPTKFLFVGPSSSGTANQITTHSRSQAVRSALGEGLVVEAACRALDVAGGSVDVLKTAASVAAANTDITKVGGHTGPTVTVAGNAVLPFDVVLTVRAGGTLGAGTFDYSLDGGKTRSEILTIPGGGSYAIPNTGLTLTFPAGTYNAGDQYTFATTPAMYNATDLTNAWAAVLKSSSEWPIIVFCGQAADAASAATLAGGVSVLMTQLANTFRYARALVDCGNDTPSNIVTAFSSVVDPRLCLVASRARIFLGRGFAGWGNPKLPFVFAFAGRLAQVKLSTNPAWRGFSGGALEGVSEPDYDESKDGEVFHPAKINAPTTDPGSSAVWPTNALLKSGASSDFRYLQWGRVVDVFCGTVQKVQQTFVHSQPRTVEGGKIDPLDAARYNKKVRGALNTVLREPVNDEGYKGHCSAVAYAVDEDNDLLASGVLQSSGSVVPHANVEQIATDIGLAREVAA